MSSPWYISLYYDDSKPDDQCFTMLDLSSHAGHELFEYMLPRMLEAAPSFADSFEGQYYGGVLTITGVSKQDFPAVYQLIMQAADELEHVKPFKQALQDALQADPRYVAHAA